MQEQLINIQHEEKLINPQTNQNIINYKRKYTQYKTFQFASPCVKLIYFCFPFLQKQNFNLKRAIFLSQPHLNPLGFPNKVVNTRYNILTFIPFTILNQFRFFGNQFYLLMTLSQFIDVLKVGFLFSYLSPLLMVLVVTLIKELFDELKRHSQDKKTNNELYTCISFDFKRKKIINTNIPSQDIKIGDILHIKKNQRAPADLLILQSAKDNDNNYQKYHQDTMYIRTDQLDGETDWKIRKPPALTYKMNVRQLFVNNIMIEYDPPSKQIYEFKGVISLYNKKKDDVQSEAINLENTMWGNTVLASEDVYGVVIYTGRDTRSKMNASKAKNKVGQLDNEINYLNKVLFVIMVILSFVVVLFKECAINFRIILFFRFIVLFCGIIPISLRVNLDLSKGYFSFCINKDPNIEGTIVRNSTIPEDLGRISYIFTDKTGTLTKNEMYFKYLALANQTFTEKDKHKLTSIINENKASNINIINSLNAIALCNNVIPIVNKDTITYQSSSPDEIALVNYASELGLKIIKRNDTEITLQRNKHYEEYQILANFPFTSTDKRMGIILKNLNTNEIVFYLKGAETVIKEFIKNDNDKCIIDSKCSDLAKKGLRTLVLTYKVLTEDEFNNWKIKYEQAKLSMENRDDNIRQVKSILENNMEFLCVTGVEDKLQDDIEISLKHLRSAGIKIWMLTGDKVETAKCISISTDLKPKHLGFYEITNELLYEHNNNKVLLSEKEQINIIKTKLNEFKTEQLKRNKHVLLIENKVIDICLHKLEREFYTAATLSDSVICCRCSPTQKSTMVKNIKKYTSHRTLAIGDGGNDVAMIQEADVGVGIEGKEGLQASLASDFSLVKFCNLNTLILWWGRVSYKNTSTMANFVIHRGLIISFIQCLFSAMFYFNPVALYNGMLILGYGTLYTNFPAMSILLDSDSTVEMALCNPSLYRAITKGRELSMKMFLIWTWKSIYQSSVIMFGAVIIFKENIFLKIITVTFTVLIFAELLNVYLEIKKFNKEISIILFATCVTYLASLILFKSILDIYFIFDIKTFSRILLLAFLCWFPLYTFDKVKRMLWPSEINKLEMKELNKSKVTL